MNVKGEVAMGSWELKATTSGITFQILNWVNVKNKSFFFLILPAADHHEEEITKRRFECLILFYYPLQAFVLSKEQLL